LQLQSEITNRIYVVTKQKHVMGFMSRQIMCRSNSTRIIVPLYTYQLRSKDARAVVHTG